MSLVELKQISENIAKITEGLDKIESQPTVHESHTGAISAFQCAPYGRHAQGLWRSMSSSSVLRDSQEGSSEDQEEGEQDIDRSTAQSKGAVGGAQRPQQASGLNLYPHMSRGFQQPQQYLQQVQPFMVPQPVYMVDSRTPAASQPDYKTCFESIKSSVSKTKLDSDWTITESKVGISSNDRVGGDCQQECKICRDKSKINARDAICVS